MLRVVRIAVSSMKWTAGIALAISASVSILPAADLSYSGSLLFGTGSYGLEERTNGFTLSNGLYLQVHRFRVSAAIPLSGQSTPLVSSTGAGIITPGGSSGSGDSDEIAGSGRSGSADDGLFTVFGIGDPTLRVDFDAIRPRRFIPSVSLFAQAKIPIADPADGLGTGEFDYAAGLSLSRSIGKESLSRRRVLVAPRRRSRPRPRESILDQRQRRALLQRRKGDGERDLLGVHGDRFGERASHADRRGIQPPRGRRARLRGIGDDRPHRIRLRPLRLVRMDDSNRLKNSSGKIMMSPRGRMGRRVRTGAWRRGYRSLEPGLP